MIFFNDRRRISSTPKRQTGAESTDPYGTKLPGGLKPRTMAEYRGRANVIAAAKAGSIKLAEPPAKVKKRNPETGELNTPLAPGKERIFKVNRPMTRLLSGSPKNEDRAGNIGREVDVKKGSRKATRLKKRAERYGA